MYTPTAQNVFNGMSNQLQGHVSPSSYFCYQWTRSRMTPTDCWPYMLCVLPRVKLSSMGVSNQSQCHSSSISPVLLSVALRHVTRTGLCIVRCVHSTGHGFFHGLQIALVFSSIFKLLLSSVVLIQVTLSDQCSCTLCALPQLKVSL